jgi:beta-galactosidase beta subunit
MTKEMKHQMDLTLALMLQMQSVIHTIDQLSNTLIYKREFKIRCENFYSFIEKEVEKTTANLDSEQSQNYIDIVKRIDDLVNEIRINEDEEH